jgi:2-polyprenyl-3-methyl-5-hydroxy-6-metoxy-1,4-benzoquinol methylase
MTAPGSDTCAACGSKAFTTRPYPGAGARGGNLSFESIRLCTTCGLGQAMPAPSQSTLDAFYSAGEYWRHTGSGGALSAHARNQCRHRLQAVSGSLPVKSDLRVLDVGAGEAWLGTLLAARLGEHLASYDFVEPDPAQRVRAAARLPAAARALELAQARRHGYDLIFLNQVLEHVADPVRTLGELAECLAEGAVLYCEVPNADYRFKQDVFPHTFFFTGEALTRLAAQARLRTLRVESFGALPGARPPLARWPASAALRFGAALGIAPLAAAGDDLLFGYEVRPGGIWLRWLGTPGSDRNA